MKMKHGLALIALGLAVSACAQNNTRVELTGADVTRSMNVGEITEIETSQIDVVYTPGANPGTITITAPETAMDYINVRVDDGELKCSLRQGVNLVRNDRRIVVAVAAPAVKSFEANLSAKIEINGHLNVGKLDIETSTSGSVTAGEITVQTEADIETSTSGSVSIATLNCNELKLESSTSGAITVGGAAQRADYEASTSGNIDANNLCALSGKLEANTSGHIKSYVVNVTHLETATGGTVTNRVE